MIRRIQVGDIVRIIPGSRPYSNDEGLIAARMGRGKVASVNYRKVSVGSMGLAAYLVALIESGGTIPEKYEAVIVFENGYANIFAEESLRVMNENLNMATNTKITKQTTMVKGKVSMESVIISEEKKDQIMAAISQVKHSDLIFQKWGFEEVFEKGTAVSILFYGVPGTGKTLASQAIADSLDAELKIYGTADIESSEPGGAERTIRKIFEEAKNFFSTNRKQRVVLFDECDSLLFDRNKVGVIMGAQINALLTEIERHEGIIIFTTNRLGKLDPALERRITAKIEFEFPDKEQRFKIWKRMIPSKAPLAKSVSFKKLAGYPLSGGNIKNVVLNAARMAAYKEQKNITMPNFLDAIEKEVAGIHAFLDGKQKSSVIGDYAVDDNRGLVIDRDSVKDIGVDKVKSIDKLKGFLGGKNDKR